MENLLKWHSLKIDGTPKLRRQCFIEIQGGFFELAFWDNRTKNWYNYFGTPPKIYDDSGGIYQTEIIKWAYVPDGFFNTELEPCQCYRPNMYLDGYDHCFGTKEIDVCSCGGDKRKCDFYD